MSQLSEIERLKGALDYIEDLADELLTFRAVTNTVRPARLVVRIRRVARTAFGAQKAGPTMKGTP